MRCRSLIVLSRPIILRRPRNWARPPQDDGIYSENDMTELKRTVTLTVNGKKYSAEAEVRRPLAAFIRHTLGLTGTHLGCEHGVCGAGTILLDGKSARSCLMLAVQAG